MGNSCCFTGKCSFLWGKIATESFVLERLLLFCKSGEEPKRGLKEKKPKSWRWEVNAERFLWNHRNFHVWAKNVVLLLESVYGYWEHKAAVGQEPVKPVHCPEHPGNTQPHSPWDSSPRQSSWVHISPQNSCQPGLIHPCCFSWSKKNIGMGTGCGNVALCGTQLENRAVFSHCHWKRKFLCLPWIKKMKKKDKFLLYPC